MKKVPRGTRRLSEKQLKAKAALIAGKSRRQAVLAAGYSQNIANSGGKTAQVLASVRVDLLSAIRANLRLSTERRAEKLADLMDAETVRWNPSTEKWDHFADGDLQLRTVQEINRADDAYPAPKEKVEDARPITIVFPSDMKSLMPAGAEKAGG